PPLTSVAPPGHANQPPATAGRPPPLLAAAAGRSSLRSNLVGIGRDFGRRMWIAWDHDRADGRLAVLAPNEKRFEIGLHRGLDPKTALAFDHEQWRIATRGSGCEVASLCEFLLQFIAPLCAWQLVDANRIDRETVFIELHTQEVLVVADAQRSERIAGMHAGEQAGQYPVGAENEAAKQAAKRGSLNGIDEAA